MKIFSIISKFFEKPESRKRRCEKLDMISAPVVDATVPAASVAIGAVVGGGGGDGCGVSPRGHTFV